MLKIIQIQTGVLKMYREWEFEQDERQHAAIKKPCRVQGYMFFSCANAR